jgi:hypothetical protein
VIVPRIRVLFVEIFVRVSHRSVKRLMFAPASEGAVFVELAVQIVHVAVKFSMVLVVLLMLRIGVIVVFVRRRHARWRDQSKSRGRE